MGSSFSKLCIKTLNGFARALHQFGVHIVSFFKHISIPKKGSNIDYEEWLREQAPFSSEEQLSLPTPPQRNFVWPFITCPRLPSEEVSIKDLFSSWLLSEAAFCLEEYLSPYTSMCVYVWPFADCDVLPSEETVQQLVAVQEVAINDAVVIDDAPIIVVPAPVAVPVPAPVAPRRSSIFDHLYHGAGDAATMIAERGVIGGAGGVASLLVGGSFEIFSLAMRRVSGEGDDGRAA